MNGKVAEMKPLAADDPPVATVEKMENGELVADQLDSDLKYMGWKAMPYVIGNETCEKLGTIGTSSNLLVYLTRIFHMKSVHATTLLNVFNGTTNLAPVFGAFLADTYLGRYTTLGFASVSSLTGMLILTLTAGISKLHPPECSEHQTCVGPSTLQLGVLYTAFAFLIVGAGGIRSCNLAFGADQFDPNTESGRKGINSFFNWYYFTFTFAMMVSATVVIYVQSSVSWSLGLAIPTVIMFFSCAFFFLGTWLYVRVKPKGSPMGGVVQVLVAAFRNRKLEYPDDPKLSLFNPSKTNTINMRLSHTDQFRFLDKASIIVSTDQIKADGLPSNPWRLCSLQQVEEVKCIARIIPVWFACMIYMIATIQHSNYVVLQALQSDRRLGNKGFQIPAGSFIIFSMLALTIWIPIYDRIIVPRLRRITGKEEGITLLQRMSVGIVISIIATIVAGLVEERRKRDAHMNPSGSNISSMSSLWLIPQLIIFGFGEVFTVIGQVEFYYKQFPENMKSIAGSMFFLGSAISNYICGFMVTIVHQTTGGNGKENSWLAEDLNKGKLDYFYFLIAAIAVLNFMYFVVCARWYRYKGVNVEPEIALEASKSKSPHV